MFDFEELDEHPSTTTLKFDQRILGAWEYGKGPKQYIINLTDSGGLQFDGPHSGSGRVYGSLESNGIWLQTELKTSDGGNVGRIRLRYDEDSNAMCSNFQGLTMPDWGQNILAQKAMGNGHVSDKNEIPAHQVKEPPQNKFQNEYSWSASTTYPIHPTKLQSDINAVKNMSRQQSSEETNPNENQSTFDRTRKPVASEATVKSSSERGADVPNVEFSSSGFSAGVDELLAYWSSSDGGKKDFDSVLFAKGLDAAAGTVAFRDLVRILGSQEEADRMLEELVWLARGSTSGLRMELKKRGYPFAIVKDGTSEKQQLLASLKDILLWEHLPSSELRKVCGRRRVPISGNESHADLLQLLCDDAWDARRIPIRKIPSLMVAYGILDRIESLEKRNMADVKAALKKKCKVVPNHLSKTAVIRLLTDLAVWEQLSAEELSALTLKIKSPAATSAGEGGLLHKSLFARSSTPSTDMAQKLLEDAVSQIMESQRSIIRRIVDPNLGEQLLQELARLEDLPQDRLREEYKEYWGLPVEPNMTSDDILERSRQLFLFQHLPLIELKNEGHGQISMLGMDRMDEEAQRKELTNRLVVHLCTTKWEALGVPVNRIGSIGGAITVVEQSERLEHLSPAELLQEWDRIGFPLPPEGLQLQNIKKAIKAAAVWHQLPLHELKKEAEQKGVTLGVSFGIGSEESQSKRIAAELMKAHCAGFFYEARGIPIAQLGSADSAAQLLEEYQRLENMSTDELAAEYERFGLPRMELPRGECLARVKDILLWSKLPCERLKDECQKRGVAIEVSSSENSKALLDRLLLKFSEQSYKDKGIPVQVLGSIESADRVAEEYARISSMTLEEVIREHKAAGFIRPPTSIRGTLEEDLRTSVLWKHMIFSELKRICQDLKIFCHFPKNELESAARRELIDRLIQAKRGKLCEELGVPLGRLGSTEAAAKLLEVFSSLDAMNPPRLVEECLQRGLPRPPSDMDIASILKKMKWAISLQELPFVELRKECVTRGVKGYHAAPESERPQMTQKLLALVWQAFTGSGARTSTGSTAGGGSSGSRGAPPFFATHSGTQKLLGYFRTLGLGSDAGIEDVKKAYKKLALKYHPDKQQHESPEHASTKFLEISEAYEALCAHLGDTVT
eukprot:TRINITY_DN73169_c0_g1_i1.p1 TRINITY_DN73169_c0_g1~~TRINITY_DN73169_c0_g1_i1.p1  ORF type:complete len:1134 (-),score=204.94 TRINITY_DN73169_c0_g1_i1:280-3681(-)